MIGRIVLGLAAIGLLSTVSDSSSGDMVSTPGVIRHPGAMPMGGMVCQMVPPPYRIGDTVVPTRVHMPEHAGRQE